MIKQAECFLRWGRRGRWEERSWTGRLRRIASLFLLFGSLELASAGAEAQVGGLYWQCVPPSSTNPQGSLCPVGNLYPLPSGPYSVSPLGYQQLTSLATAAALTVPAGASTAEIECDSVSAVGVRFRDDGTAPTATVGMELLPGASFFYTGDLTKLQFIQVSASAKLNVSYYSR